jgi:hypothetical protein
MKKPVKRNEKTNTGEGGKGKRGRTDSDDVGGKSLSDTSTSARGQCVGESSTGVTSTTNLSSINLVSIFRCSSNPRNPVYVSCETCRSPAESDLDFSLSSHRYSYVGLLFNSRFIT